MIQGSIIGVAKADTRSFDYSSCKACGEGLEGLESGLGPGFQIGIVKNFKFSGPLKESVYSQTRNPKR